MNFRVLPDHLHGTARGATKYFARTLGASRFAVEEEIAQDVQYRPTLHSILPDKSIVCVEVTEDPSAPELSGFVLECKNRIIPAKLWIAVPRGIVSELKTKEICFARDNGVGIMEVDTNGVGREFTSAPLSLSLTGLRELKFSDYPSKYRGSIKQGYDSFVQGNPAKGCSLIYDELEHLTRRIAKRASQKGFLRRAPQFNIDNEAWANVLEFLKANLDSAAAGTPLLRVPVFSRLIGLTEYRNLAGHKPSSTKKLIERDTRLRTLFESAVDELRALINASKSLGV